MGKLKLMFKQRRYTVCFFTFIGFAVQYMMRINLSVTQVIMREEFKWNQAEEGYIMASFFYGYTVTQLPGGYLANRIGGKIVFLGSVFLCSICSLASPLCAQWNLIAFFITRVILGLSQGVLFPCSQAVFSKWLPPAERSKLALIAMSGAYFGSIISNFTSGYIMDSIGWHVVFYLHGIFGLIWCILWQFFTSATPLNDKWITDVEKQYLIESLNLLSEQSKRNPKPPMKKILLSLPVWAIILSHFATSWGFYFLFVSFPSFLRDIYNVDNKLNGVLSSLPYFALGFLSPVAGYLADLCIKKKYMKVVNVRKVFNCGAFVLHTIGILGTVFWMTLVGSTICVTFTIGVGAFAWAGFGINHLDICPQFASVTMGLSNTGAAIPGFITPGIGSALIETYGPKTGYKISFCIAAVVYIFGFFIYAIFAQGIEQPWAKGPKPHEQSQSTINSSSNHSIYSPKPTFVNTKYNWNKFKETWCNHLKYQFSSKFMTLFTIIISKS